MEKLKKKILRWLFGTDNVKRYVELLNETMNHTQESLGYINDHLETLKEARENLEDTRKLIQICKNHGIDIDEEIKHIEL